jgi:histidinol-phosphate phosphatase family protein
MVPFHGRPFLEYLLEYFKEQGISRCLILLGYLHDKVTSHFGDGSDFGIEIEYDIQPVEYDTGSRLRAAYDKIGPEFLMVYCDNYCPLNLKAVAEEFRKGGRKAQFVVYRNRDGYTNSNLRVEDGAVSIYDKTRNSPGLEGVEIGFLMADKEILDLLPPDGNPSFEKEVFPRLIAEGQLGAYLTDHRYYSVGKTERLPLTRAFLERKPTIFLDRDGVLNRKAPKACYVKSWDEWDWLPGARESVGRLSQEGYKLILITNQAGIARGRMTLEDLGQIHAKMRADLVETGGKIEDIYYCPHGWNEGCECRKPNIGMFLEAQRKHHLDLSRCLYIGDDERDAIAAEKAGCPFEMVDKNQSLADIVNKLLDEKRNPNG